MSSKKQMVSYTNEDYELMEAIKSLPDDMILEIKAYVISPYKYMAELKLYKCPTFIMDEDGDICRKLFFKDYYNGVSRSRDVNYEIEFNDSKLLQVHKIIGNFEIIGERRVLASNFVKDREVIHQMKMVKTNKQYKNRQLLKDLEIKGRTKLIKESNKEIIAAIMKGS